MTREILEAILEEKPVDLRKHVHAAMKAKIEDNYEAMQRVTAENYFLEDAPEEELFEDEEFENTDDEIDPEAGE